VVIKKKERLILEGRFDHLFDHGNVPVVIECIAIKTDCSKNKKRKIPTNPYPAMRIETAKYHEIETIFQKHHSICRHVLVSLLSGFEERGKKTQENVQHENIYPVIQLIQSKCAPNTQNDPKKFMVPKGRRGNFMKILSFLGYKYRIHKN